MTNGGKLAKAVENWDDAIPIVNDKKTCAKIISYAENKGIKIYDGYKYDGDITLLREQIDIIADMRQEYGLKQKITILFEDMPDGDYAKTENDIMMFNKKSTPKS